MDLGLKNRLKIYSRNAGDWIYEHKLGLRRAGMATVFWGVAVGLFGGYMAVVKSCLLLIL